MPRGAKWTPLRRAKVDHTLKRKRRIKYEALYKAHLADEQAAKIVLDSIQQAANKAADEAKQRELEAARAADATRHRSDLEARAEAARLALAEAEAALATEAPAESA